jgi:hypothetical protein
MRTLTIAEAMDIHRRAVGGPASWLTMPVKDRSGIEQMEREHAEKIAKLKKDADERIEKSRQHQRDLVAKNQRRRELWREEQIVKHQEADRVELTWRQDHREFIAAIGGKLDALDQKWLDDELEGERDESETPAVRRMVSWLEQVWRDEAIDVRSIADPRLANGSAHRGARYIYIAEPKNRRLCVIAAHETAHVAHAELEDNREVPDADGFHKVSVPQELASWQWVLDHIPAWDETMHAFMTRCINSYGSYATGDEKKAITDLCSDLGFRRTQLRCSLGE